MSAEGGPDVQDELATTVAALCHLQGEFMLRSGQTTSVYFDKCLFEAEPAVLGLVARRMAALVPADTEVLAGLELGGVPVATALSLETGIPTAFVRKQAKTYGTAKLAEGSEVAGRRVLVVEDVITTGGQVVASTEQLRALGATVEAVLCVIDRSAGDHTRFDSIGLETISLFRGRGPGLTATRRSGAGSTEWRRRKRYGATRLDRWRSPTSLFMTPASRSRTSASTFSSCSMASPTTTGSRPPNPGTGE